MASGLVMSYIAGVQLRYVLILGGLSHRKIVSYAAYITTTAATFGIYAVADLIYVGTQYVSAEKIQHLSIFWTLIVLVPMLCLLAWKTHEEWQNCREINDQLLSDINKNKARIKQIDTIVAKFRYNTKSIS